MCKYMLDAIHGGFAGGIMGLTESSKRYTIPISHLTLFFIMVKQ